MADRAETQLDIRDFVGMIDSFDPEDFPAGAADNQVNMICCVVGEMSTRKGYRLVTFEQE